MSRSAGLRFLHWNVHSWLDESGADNVDRVADLVQSVSADVVSLVEVDEPVGGPSRLAALAAATSFNSIFVPAFQYGRDRPVGYFGNALLVRMPVQDVRHVSLLWPPPRYDGSEPSEQRSVVLGRISIAAGSVWIGSTHLPRADPAARTQALQRAISMMLSLPTPWLLMGDFNIAAIEWSRDYPTLQVHPPGPAPTHPTSHAVESIDYCVSPAGQQVQAEVLVVDGSDHLPILGWLQL